MVVNRVISREEVFGLEKILFSELHWPRRVNNHPVAGHEGAPVFTVPEENKHQIGVVARVSLEVIYSLSVVVSAAFNREMVVLC